MSIVVIPAYQPDKELIEIADKFWMYGCRMVVVDDGSGEAYQNIFHKIQDICTILRHPENRGKGAAIKTALSYIEEKWREDEVVGIIDCDGQHLPEDLLNILAFAENHEKTLYLGVRKVGKEMPLRSRMGNEITKKVFQMVSGVQVSDTQTGLRVFPTEYIPKMLVVKGDRYEYEMNVLMTFAKENIPIRELPIHTIYRDQENSTSHFRTVVDSLRIYKDIFKFTLSSFSSFLLDYLLFVLGMCIVPHTAWMVLAVNVAARMISAFYNYSMNCRFVFHTRRKMQTATQYFALAAGILILNNVCLQAFLQGCHFSVYVSKILTELTLFCISWLVQRCLIFRKKNGTTSGHGIHAAYDRQRVENDRKESEIS